MANRFQGQQSQQHQISHSFSRTRQLVTVSAAPDDYLESSHHASESMMRNLIYLLQDYCIVEEGSPKIDDEHQFCYDELRISYIGILVSKMIVDAAMDIALPYFLTQLKRWQTHGELQSVEATKEEQLSVENQLLMTEYDTSLWDYNQLVTIMTFNFLLIVFADTDFRAGGDVWHGLAFWCFTSGGLCNDTEWC